MTGDYERFGKVFEEVQIIVGKIGNVRMVTGLGYTTIISTFKFADYGDVRIDDYYGRICKAAGNDSQTKLTSERDGQGKVLVKISTSFPTSSPPEDAA